MIPFGSKNPPRNDARVESGTARQMSVEDTIKPLLLLSLEKTNDGLTSNSDGIEYIKNLHIVFISNPYA